MFPVQGGNWIVRCVLICNDKDEVMMIGQRYQFIHADCVQENLNAVCDTANYSLTTQQSMALLNEKEIPFELIVVCRI